MTDPNDTPVLDLGAMESLCRELNLGEWSSEVAGDESTIEVLNAVPALVARLRADAERIAALTAERDDARKDAVEWSDATDDLREALAQSGRDVDALEAERDDALARVRALDDACLALRAGLNRAEETAECDDALWAEQRERVAALEAIIAGREQPPTPDDVRTHPASWWLRQPPDAAPELWCLSLYAEAFVSEYGPICALRYEFEGVRGRPLPTDGRWWPLHRGPVAWPVTP